MTISKEDLILKEVAEIASDVRELKKESKTHGEALVRLEANQTNQKIQCKMLHISVDKRLDNLEDFEEKTGTHNANELKSKANKAIDWNTWSMRLLLAIPVSVITAAIVMFIKGCGS